MRIGIFTDTYSPDINGVTTSINTVESGLKKLGHDVFMFAPNQEFRYLPLPQQRVWRLPSVRFYGEKRFRVAFPFLFSNDLFSLPIDLVHTQTPFSVGFIGLRFAQHKHLPTVHTYHTRYQEYNHYFRLPKFILKFATRMGMNRIIKFLNNHDAIIAPSLGIRRELESFGVQQPISIIPTGIDIAETTSLADAQEPHSILEKLNLDDGAELVIFTGRLAKEKNIEFLLKTMLTVISARPKTYFLIIGDGTEKENLEKFAKKIGLGHHVIFTGFMNHEAIFPLYKAAKIFIFSSQTETQGLVLLEAMALGLPVVALRAIGVEDLIEKDIGGFLVDNMDATLFSKKILELLENQELYEKKSAEAKNRAQDFSIEKTTRLLLDVYKSLV